MRNNLTPNGTTCLSTVTLSDFPSIFIRIQFHSNVFCTRFGCLALLHVDAVQFNTLEYKQKLFIVRWSSISSMFLSDMSCYKIYSSLIPAYIFVFYFCNCARWCFSLSDALIAWLRFQKVFYRMESITITITSTVAAAVTTTATTNTTRQPPKFTRRKKNGK